MNINIPAYCPNHGLFSSGFIIGPAATASTINCKSTCPKCGKECEVLNCEVSTADRIISILSPNSVSVAVLKQLKEIAQQVADESKTLEQARAEADAVSPGTGELFNPRSWSNTDKLTAIGTILTCITALVAAQVGRSPAQPEHSGSSPAISQPINENNNRGIEGAKFILPPKKETTGTRGPFKLNRAERRKLAHEKRRKKRH